MAEKREYYKGVYAGAELIGNKDGNPVMQIKWKLVEVLLENDSWMALTPDRQTTINSRILLDPNADWYEISLSKLIELNWNGQWEEPDFAITAPEIIEEVQVDGKKFPYYNIARLEKRSAQPPSKSKLRQAQEVANAMLANVRAKIAEKRAMQAQPQVQTQQTPPPQMQQTTSQQMPMTQQPQQHSYVPQSQQPQQNPTYDNISDIPF